MSIGFIGAGKIAQSLIKGLVSAGMVWSGAANGAILVSIAMTGISKADRILASAPKEDIKCHLSAQVCLSDSQLLTKC